MDKAMFGHTTAHTIGAGVKDYPLFFCWLVSYSSCKNRKSFMVSTSQSFVCICDS